MSKFPNITLSILSGGKSTRMGGKNKALLEVDGQTFISRIHQRLDPLFKNKIIISNEVTDFQIPNVKVFSDILRNVGPLGGIHSSLLNSNDPFVFVVSCDMPFVDPQVASVLVEEFNRTNPEILVPMIENYMEPLFAIYSKGLVARIESIVALKEGSPITEIFKIANTSYLHLPNNFEIQRCFTNINSPDDLLKHKLS